MSKFYITTPIYYVNNAPHIGHTYTTVAADVLARFHRIIGDKTFFLTGTDEHGAKIEEMAKKENKDPQEFADQIADKFKLAWEKLNISNDRFIRTTEKKHKQAAQKALQYMYDKGDIYLGKFEGLYCKGCEQYKGEKDLVNGKCPDHNMAPEKISEECYMFKLSAYQDKLFKIIKDDKLKIYPKERKNEILNFYKEGLRDISFSRKNVKWGIVLPWDKNHTTYVWADAFLNYLTGLGWDGSAKNAPELWPADIHLMSKDIIRVHATIWPAMLLSLGLPLPKKLFVHGFFLVDGQKMSKSLGNVISPEDLAKKYGVDGARYLLMSATVFGHDGDISWKKFDEKYNADLANGLGNLVQRVAGMINKYQAGKISDLYVELKKRVKIEKELQKPLEKISNIKNNIEELRFDEALKEIWRIISFVDLYIDKNKPWVLAKEDMEKLKKVLSNLRNYLLDIAWFLTPFMPETAKTITEIFKGPEIKITKPLFPRLT